jgi:hypothetical protein
MKIPANEEELRQLADEVYEQEGALTVILGLTLGILGHLMLSALPKCLRDRVVVRLRIWLAD